MTSSQMYIIVLYQYLYLMSVWCPFFLLLVLFPQDTYFTYSAESMSERKHALSVFLSLVCLSQHHDHHFHPFKQNMKETGKAARETWCIIVHFGG